MIKNTATRTVAHHATDARAFRREATDRPSVDRGWADFPRLHRQPDALLPQGGRAPGHTTHTAIGNQFGHEQCNEIGEYPHRSPHAHWLYRPEGTVSSSQKWARSIWIEQESDLQTCSVGDASIDGRTDAVHQESETRVTHSD